MHLRELRLELLLPHSMFCGWHLLQRSGAGQCCFVCMYAFCQLARSSKLVKDGASGNAPLGDVLFLKQVSMTK